MRKNIRQKAKAPKAKEIHVEGEATHIVFDDFETETIVVCFNFSGITKIFTEQAYHIVGVQRAKLAMDRKRYVKLLYVNLFSFAELISSRIRKRTWKNRNDRPMFSNSRADHRLNLA